MSIQDKIAISQILFKRKIRDHSIFVNGIESKVIRLKVTENRYSDETLSVINHETLTLALDIPDDIPLDRLRNSDLEPTFDTQSVFLFDILPIVGTAKHTDNIEKGDILILKILDEVASHDPLLWTLRVSEILGSINNRYLVNRSFQCAPYNLTLTAEIQEIISIYEGLN